LNEYSTLAAELGSDAALDRFYFLGSGVRYGMACEASLKMKEMSLSHSEPFYFLEFRHGPKSMVTPGTLVVGLLSDAQRQPEQAVLDEMRGLGGRVLALGESGADVAIQSGLSEPARSGLYLLVLQLLAYARARHKGLNPDQPTNLDAFVALK
jgi:glucosamine--fructose-6-phosphate aminotransferase (isomerizing)